MPKPTTKKINYPKTQNEAFELVFKLCKDFEFQAVLISENDFQEHFGTEKWTKKDYKQAVEIALEELCSDVGYVLDEALIQVNKNKNLN
jgi:predicted SAM-dependent methyltransferase